MVKRQVSISGTPDRAARTQRRCTVWRGVGRLTEGVRLEHEHHHDTMSTGGRVCGRACLGSYDPALVPEAPIGLITKDSTNS